LDAMANEPVLLGAIVATTAAHRQVSINASTP
jgi:hypothetical protein